MTSPEPSPDPAFGPDDTTSEGVTPAPTSGVSPGSSSGVTPAPTSGVSPAPEPPTAGAGPTGVPMGTAPSGRRGCLGGAGATVVLLAGSAIGAGSALVQVWRALTG
jgi:hypothetical protein